MHFRFERPKGVNVDPIADMFSQIKNAQDSDKNSLSVPFSKMKMAILEVLKINNYIKEYREPKSDKKENIREIEIILNKDRNYKIQRISKPGRRVYASTARIPKAGSPQGMVIVSTSEGLMIGEDARRKRLGGEIIAEII